MERNEDVKKNLMDAYTTLLESAVDTQKLSIELELKAAASLIRKRTFHSQLGSMTEPTVVALVKTLKTTKKGALRLQVFRTTAALAKTV